MSVQGHDSTERDEKAIKAQLDAKTEADDLTWLMSDTRGRRFMWRLLSGCGLYAPSYVPGSDAMATAFNEGNRNTGLKLIGQVMQHCPDRFSEMQKEARRHERRNDRSSSK